MGQGGSSANAGGDENKDEERKWTRFYKAKEKKNVNRQLEWEKNRSPEEKEADEEATRKLRKQRERERARARVEAEYESSEEDEDRDEAKRKRKKKKKKKHHKGSAMELSDDEENQLGKKGEEVDEEEKKSEEQRRREEEEERRKEKIEAEAELVDPVYEGDPLYSREKWNAMWSFAKAILYFLFLAAGLTIYSTDYNKRTCVQEKLEVTQQTYCLDYDSSAFYCVSYDDATYGAGCQSECRTSPPSDGGGPEGCRYSLISQSSTCFSPTQMYTNCLDQKTCPDSSDSSIRRGALLISMLFLVGFATEMGFCLSLWLMADWTASDFVAEGGKYKMGWLFFVKNFPPFAQLVHIGLMFAVFYGLFLVMTIPTTCKIYSIETATGGTYAFYSDATLYVQVTAALLVVTTVIGTAVRIQPLCHIRGQLFRPAPPAGRVPGWLVCDRCKSRPYPRLCPGCIKSTENLLKHSTFLACCAWIPDAVGFVLDKLATPLFILGKLLEWVIVNRHFVGP